MDIREKTPKQQLVTKFRSIQSRLDKGGLTDDERERAQKALEHTRQQLRNMGVVAQ